VNSNKLPNCGKDKFPFTLGDVDTSNPNKFTFISESIFHIFYSMIVAIVFIEVILRWVSNNLPISGAWLDLINDLIEENSILALFNKIRNKDVWNTKGINPSSEHSFFFRSLNIIVNKTNCIIFLLGKLFKTMLCIENIRNEKCVNFNITL